MDNGKENGNYYNITGYIGGYIRIAENEMETTIWVVVTMMVPFWVPYTLGATL